MLARSRWRMKTVRSGPTCRLPCAPSRTRARTHTCTAHAGKLSPPNPSALAALCSTTGVHTVVLNACETLYQGQLLHRHGVPHVVAARSLLSDQCGVEYAKGFYDYLFNAAADRGAGGAPSLFEAAHSHGDRDTHTLV